MEMPCTLLRWPAWACACIKTALLGCVAVTRSRDIPITHSIIWSSVLTRIRGAPPRPPHHRAHSVTNASPLLPHTRTPTQLFVFRLTHYVSLRRLPLCPGLRLPVRPRRRLQTSRLPARNQHQHRPASHYRPWLLLLLLLLKPEP